MVIHSSLISWKILQGRENTSPEGLVLETATLPLLSV
jgi:hypothetical protein